MRKKNAKIIFLVTEDWYFWSHRLPMARAARTAGFDVGIATRVNLYGEQIQAEGFTLHSLDWTRRSLSVFQFFNAVRDVAVLYRREKPDIVHHVALKPVVVGSLAAKLVRLPRIVNAMTGLGHLFTSTQPKTRFLRFLLRPLLRLALSGKDTTILLQNNDDLAMLKRLGFERSNAVVIRGSGIDVAHYKAMAVPVGPALTAAFVGRMIEIKGVRVLMQAHRKLRERGISLRLLLVGNPDTENPGAISELEMSDWNKEPDVEWLGHISDVRDVWAVADIAVLPSLGGEGLPKSLLEAAACGRPIVATDVPGTREIAVSDRNAILVPPNDPIALADALERMAGDVELRRSYGQKSRCLVESDMAQGQVAQDIAALYTRLMADEAISRQACV